MSDTYWLTTRATLVESGDRVQIHTQGGRGTVVRVSLTQLPDDPAGSMVILHIMPLHPDDTLPPGEYRLTRRDYVAIERLRPEPARIHRGDAR